MRYFSLSLLLLGCLFVSCQPTEETDAFGFIVTDAGTRYQMIDEAGSSEEVDEGEFVYFQVKMISQNDSLLFDTRDGGEDNIPIVQAAPDSVSVRGPVEDIIRYMAVGDVARIRMNIEDQPAQSRPPGIASDSIIFYEVEVTEVIDEETFAVRREEIEAKAEAARALIQEREPEALEQTESMRAQYAAGSLPDVQTTESGLKYVILEQGDGERAEAGRGVTVNYVGALAEDGTVFDQSFQRGEGIPFPLGQGAVIPGWDEGIALLNEGGRAMLFIPSELGYGTAGSPRGGIPPGAELVFYVELEDVQ